LDDEADIDVNYWMSRGRLSDN